ncbi:hypothetical protein ACHAWF_010872 [Thalassiosira exigua]
MAPVPRYGSISSSSLASGDGDGVEVGLLQRNGATDGCVDRGGADVEGSSFLGDVDASGGKEAKKGRWTKHRCASYALAALLCLFAARYYRDRAESYDGGVETDDAVEVGGVGGGGDRKGRVPTPPALSALDPSRDLGFRSTTRKGLASPSKAWGDYLRSSDDEEEDDGEGFAPLLPTNAWYLNLLSHRAAADPSAAGEVAHVYTVPYVVGVSPPAVPSILTGLLGGGSGGGGDEGSHVRMAGIQLFLPVLKAGASNMQMVFDEHNGISLGALVSERAGEEDGEEERSAPASYAVDPDAPLSPLGVSLKWNHVNLKTHVVRGMPYGTVRFGRDAKTKGTALPVMMSGSRVASLTIDSDGEEGSGKGTKMTCGSLTGKPIVVDPNHPVPLTKDGKAKAYAVEREVIFHMDQSDFTWVAFFSKPVKVECYTDAMPAVSVPGGDKQVQFALRVVEVPDDDDGGDATDDDELVVRVALLNECTTGKSIIKEHCNHLKELKYETVSGKDKRQDYLDALRAGKGTYARSPMVGTQFPGDDAEGGDGAGEEDGADGGNRATDVIFDWDATSVGGRGTASSEAKAAQGAEASPEVAEAFRLRPATRASSSSSFPATDEAEAAAEDDFVAFALPHHLEALSSSIDDGGDALCLHTFHGRTCLVRGPVWTMTLKHGPPQSFLADRPPAAVAVPEIAKALAKDVGFKLSPNVLRGAADTYFPAKILAKMGRIVEIRDELQRLKDGEGPYDYSDADDAYVQEAASAAAEVDLPAEEEVELLLDDLQTAVQIWLKPGGKEKGGAEAEFLYDSSWGGFVNCGCAYVFKKGHADRGSCNNTFPECPALADVNEDFGNGWYNDHHFHYGYHIYAAAVVARHRPEWAREYFERVLLYVRDVANPSPDDAHFPQFRQKDWYLGNSWAAGLMSAELSPHGREQESSSEAIAAWEGIALYGAAMMEVFADDEENLASARLVRDVGELLTALEVSAANRFWHVWGSKTDEEDSALAVVTGGPFEDEKLPHINTYPKKYTKPVVGMMHETMASFQTWFAPEDVVSYGIQLIPLTAVAERRDDPEWVNVLYPVYAESCEAADDANSGFCEKNGWSIPQAGLLAETGAVKEALEMANSIPDKVFISLGGDGNSRTNTLWFVSTRRQPSETER